MKKPDQKSRDFSHLLIWKDGELIPLPEAQVHILSHSFGRGSAVFEVLSTHRAEKGTFVFRLKDHLNRLFRSARALYMKIPYAQKTLIQAIKQVVASNQLGEGLLKILVFYPDICLEITPPQKNLSVAIAGFDFQRDISWSKFGEDKFAKAGISRWRKLSPETVPVFAKASGNYLNPMLAKLEVKERSFSAPILLDTKGYVAEGATESIFIVKNQKLYTPKLDNILPSITRMSILQLARDLKIPVREKRIRPDELLQADEAFFSSTTCKVWHIARIEDKIFPAPGKVSKRLEEYFQKILAGKIEKYLHWLTLVKTRS